MERKIHHPDPECGSGTGVIFTESTLSGAYLIDIQRLEDERGFFARSFCQHEFDDHQLDINFVQCNISFNRSRGTLRGMHYQVSPFEEAKLVRCVRGSIYDVIVDLRPYSETYLKWVGYELSQDNFRMVYVPKGFAHGFITLSDDTEIFYQMSQFYAPQCARGLRWDDPLFQIHWPQPVCSISEKDKNYPDVNLESLIE